MDMDILKLLGVGGGFTVAMGLVAWMVQAIMGRLVKVIDKLAERVEGLGVRIEQHTATDLQHHSDTQQALAQLDGRITGIMEERDTQPEEVSAQHHTLRRPNEYPTMYSQRRNPRKGK